MIREDRGQSVVELALVLPFLLVIILGIVGFGVYFEKYQSVTSAVRVAARQASICSGLPATAQKPSVAGNSAYGGTLTWTFTPTTMHPDNTPCTDVVEGSLITVKGSTSSAFSLNLGFFSLSIPLSSTEQVVEQ